METAYDISTILILWFAGASAMGGTVDVIIGLRSWTSVPILVLSGRSGSSDKSRRSTPVPTTT